LEIKRGAHLYKFLCIVKGAKALQRQDRMAYAQYFKRGLKATALFS